MKQVAKQLVKIAKDLQGGQFSRGEHDIGYPKGYDPNKPRKKNWKEKLKQVVGEPLSKGVKTLDKSLGESFDKAGGKALNKLFTPVSQVFKKDSKPEEPEKTVQRYDTYYHKLRHPVQTLKGYKYVWDPRHIQRPEGGGWEETEAGWSRKASLDPTDRKIAKQLVKIAKDLME